MTRGSRQQKIIRNFYEHKDEIMFQQLSEIVSELYLATERTRQNALWQRAEKAMRSMKMDEPEIQRILANRSPQALAKLLTEKF